MKSITQWIRRRELAIQNFATKSRAGTRAAGLYTFFTTLFARKAFMPHPLDSDCETVTANLI
jgi:hypothetical protein